MNKLASIVIITVFALGGVWYFASHTEDEHGHERPHVESGHEHETDTLEVKEPVRADGTFTIATSFYPLAFALETITEGVAKITNIGEGRDPHDVQLSTQDILTLQKADLVVLQGVDLEPWGDDIAHQLRREDVPVVLATRGLSLREGGHHDHGEGREDNHAEEEHHADEDRGHGGEDEHAGEEHGEEHTHGAFDPHTWLDPVLFGQSVVELTRALISIDPENAELYEERSAALQAELAAIDAAYTDRLATCSLNEVITSHDAFGYLGERYGFEIHTIAGISTQDLPSARTLAELKAEAEEGVGAILLEENSISAFGETLSNETGLRTLSINPIAYIVSDGEDYLSLMRTNLNVFADALQCE
jgi:zinc transport system substrate-binding protein